MASYPHILLALQNFPPPSGAIEKMFGLMLYGAMRSQRPETVLELGTGSGYSTAWILLGLEENEFGHLWTIDVAVADNPVWRQVNLPESRLDYLSNDLVAKAEIPTRFDFIFHDAGHSLEEVKGDLERLLPYLAVGGSFVIHDVSHVPAMGDYVLDYFDSRPGEWKYERFEEGCGVGIATRLKAPETLTCKAESNGSTISRDSDSSPEKTGKTTSRISRKLKGKATAPSRKTNTSSSSRSSSKKGQEQPRLAEVAA